MYELKIDRGVFVMAIKSEAKSQEKLICQFKIDMRNDKF